jgi:hypothetical protein
MTLRKRFFCSAGKGKSCGKPHPHFPSKGARANVGMLRFSRWPLVVAVLVLSIGFAVPGIHSAAQDFGQNTRVVQGKVLDPDEKPQPNAIVYLQNQKTLEIRTYITIADGSYRFGQVGSDVDYRLWAKYQTLKSKAKLISSFDSKKQFTFDLKLEPSKE